MVTSMKLEVLSRCRVTEPVVRSCTSIPMAHGASYREGSGECGYACAVSAHECEISSTGHGLTHRHRVRRGHLRPRPRACRRRRHPAPGSRRHVVARLGSRASARRQPAPRTPFRALPEARDCRRVGPARLGVRIRPADRAVLAPLRDAGFAVDAVLCPADALCALAKRRQKAAGRAGEVWLALNRQRVAMAIVEDGRLLYSRGFDWHYSPAATQRAELLQRYSLVAHLAPEISHGIDLVRAEHGASVSAIVTCGDLPDLRSLTMPLIEELDIEVETLDTLDGVSVEGVAAGEAIAEQAPAIRLACAAAPASAVSGNERWRPVAAAVVLLAILVGAWTVMRSLSGSGAGLGPQEQSRQSETPVQSAPAPAPKAAESHAATSGRTPPAPEPAPPADSRVGASSTARPAEPPPYEPGGRVNRDDAAPRRDLPASPATSSSVRRGAPLSSPLPIVSSILIAQDRRLAILDGEIVREGDAVGPRVVVRIERGAVVLREPSGYEVRVPIRRKLN